MHIGPHSTDYQPTVHVDQVSIECQLSIDWDVDQVSIEMSMEGNDGQSTADAF